MAYSGRAAAYEKTGDFDRAVADYKMLVFSYAIELDADDPKGDGYNDLLREAARAYRTRSACLQARGETAAAERDLRRAGLLNAKIKKAVEKEKAQQARDDLPGKATVSNYLSEPVTLLISGITYTFRAGETKTMATPLGSFPYEMQLGTYKVTGNLNAGQAYNIGMPPVRP